jgi:hypothetical protein
MSETRSDGCNVVKDAATGKLAADTIDFEVK